MDKNTPVSKVMTRKVIVADLHNTLSQAQKLFLDYQIYHLPVVYDDKILGIVSVKDALKTYRDKVKELSTVDTAIIDEHVKLEDIMTHTPKTVHPDATIGEVVAVLAEARFRSLPVVDNDGKVVGIISNKDLVRILNHLFKD